MSGGDLDAWVRAVRELRELGASSVSVGRDGVHVAFPPESAHARAQPTAEPSAAEQERRADVEDEEALLYMSSAPGGRAI